MGLANVKRNDAFLPHRGQGPGSSSPGGRSSLDRAGATVRHSGLVPTATPSTTYLVQHQPRSEGIVQTALDVPAEVLVLLARPRSILDSMFGWDVAAQMAHISPVPLLLLTTQTKLGRAQRTACITNK